jgi:hypothetical protein
MSWQASMTSRMVVQMINCPKHYMIPLYKSSNDFSTHTCIKGTTVHMTSAGYGESKVQNAIYGTWVRVHMPSHGEEGEAARMLLLEGIGFCLWAVASSSAAPQMMWAV